MKQTALNIQKSDVCIAAPYDWQGTPHLTKKRGRDNVDFLVQEFRINACELVLLPRFAACVGTKFEGQLRHLKASTAAYLLDNIRNAAVNIPEEESIEDMFALGGAFRQTLKLLECTIAEHILLQISQITYDSGISQNRSIDFLDCNIPVERSQVPTSASPGAHVKSSRIFVRHGLIT